MTKDYVMHPTPGLPGFDHVAGSEPERCQSCIVTYDPEADGIMVTIPSDWFRPRDEFDVDVDPRSFRGQILAMHDAVDDARAKIRAAPWYLRWPLEGALRLQSWRRRSVAMLNRRAKG